MQHALKHVERPGGSHTALDGKKMARGVKMEMLSDLRLLSCIWLMFLCHLLVVLPLFADFVWTLSEISLICMFLFSGIAGLKPFRAMVWTHPLVIFPGNVLARHNKKRVWKWMDTSGVLWRFAHGQDITCGFWCILESCMMACVWNGAEDV